MNLPFKKFSIYSIAAIIVSSCGNTDQKTNEQQDTTTNEQEEWITLFDGETTNGWHTYLQDTVASGWTAMNGELRFNPDVPSEGRGDIVTDESFENFELELEWQISSAGNSGIFIGVHEDPQYGNTYATGIEMQVLDNIEAADNQIETHLAGSMYDMIGSTEVSQPKPVGEWNQVRILNNQDELTFWLNGIQTAHVVKGSEQWQTLLNASKFKDWKGFAQYENGKIGLQDHGDVVAYRNIRIKKL